MGCLILVRHGESIWNEKGLWTGLADVSLSENGFKEAKDAGMQLKDEKFDLAFTSVLKRGKETLDEIKKYLVKKDFPIIEDTALNERDYGVYTGKNKWEIKKEIGEKHFLEIRRGWDCPIKNGESLKDVYNRVIPYFESKILPNLKLGKNVLVVLHSNSMRALVKHLDSISNGDIEKLEIATGEIYIYQIDENGKVVSKEIKNYKPNLV